MSAFARDFGPVVRGRFGTLLVHLVTGPDAVRHILQENARNYDKNTDDYDLLSLALGKGLVTSEGELWRRQRRIAASPNRLFIASASPALPKRCPMPYRRCSASGIGRVSMAKPSTWPNA